MNITPMQTPVFVEPKQHPGTCQCPGCCKNDGNTQAAASYNTLDRQQSDAVSLTKQELDIQERQQLAQLQQRDSEVRAHEAAHIAAGGAAISGSASFSYQKGPDGRLYAIGGEVPITIGTGSTPQETIQIAKQIQAGALAPASPSPQDFKVAASAALMEARARQEIAQESSDALYQKAIDAYKSNQVDASI